MNKGDLTLQGGELLALLRLFPHALASYRDLVQATIGREGYLITSTRLARTVGAGRAESSE